MLPISDHGSLKTVYKEMITRFSGKSGLCLPSDAVSICTETAFSDHALRSMASSERMPECRFSSRSRSMTWIPLTAMVSIFFRTVLDMHSLQ
jgi:hypothetical protein